MCSTDRYGVDWQAKMLDRCGEFRDEDLLHFVLECPAYDHIRDMYMPVFTFPAGAGLASCMQSVFDAMSQKALARCIGAMDTYRRHVLGKGVLFGVKPILQPEGYVTQLVYPSCLRGADARFDRPQEMLPAEPGAPRYIVLGVALVACLLVLICVLSIRM